MCARYYHRRKKVRNTSRAFPHLSGHQHNHSDFVCVCVVHIELHGPVQMVAQLFEQHVRIGKRLQTKNVNIVV